jgi:metal-sulfur cluster biosynthetic enzyme
MKRIDMDDSKTNESHSENQAAGSDEQPQESPASVPGTGLTEDKVREQLKQVIDPELFVNIVDLGLIYVVDLNPSETEGKIDVTVEMTMTSPMCPAGPQLVANSREAVESLEEVEKVEIKVVMDPPWTQDMMSEDAKDQLNIF